MPYLPPILRVAYSFLTIKRKRSYLIATLLIMFQPVLATIAHRDEHIDGSGFPKGIRGEEIPLTAKILAVANAFVALVSSRAYREGLNVDKALDILLDEAKTKYDRHVVAALFHVAENRPNWIEWRAASRQ